MRYRLLILDRVEYRVGEILRRYEPRDRLLPGDDEARHVFDAKGAKSGQLLFHCFDIVRSSEKRFDAFGIEACAGGDRRKNGAISNIPAIEEKRPKQRLDDPQFSAKIAGDPDETMRLEGIGLMADFFESERPPELTGDICNIFEGFPNVLWRAVFLLEISGAILSLPRQVGIDLKRSPANVDGKARYLINDDANQPQSDETFWARDVSD